MNWQNWYLEPHQKGQIKVLLQHIQTGVELLMEEDAVLVFSGGQTRAGAGPRTEAFSYYVCVGAHARA